MELDRYPPYPLLFIMAELSCDLEISERLTNSAVLAVLPHHSTPSAGSDGGLITLERNISSAVNPDQKVSTTKTKQKSKKVSTTKRNKKKNMSNKYGPPNCCPVRNMNLMRGKCLCGQREFDELFLEESSALAWKTTVNSVLGSLPSDVADEIKQFYSDRHIELECSERNNRPQFSSVEKLVQNIKDFDIVSDVSIDVNPNRLHIDRVRRKGNKKPLKKDNNRDKWNAQANPPALRGPNRHRMSKKERRDYERSKDLRHKIRVQSGEEKSVQTHRTGEYVDMVHDFILLIEDCSQNFSMEHLYLALTRYLRRINRDVTQDLIDYTIKLVKSKIRIQSGEPNFIEKLGLLLGNTGVLATSSFAVEAFNFIKQIISLSLFTKMGFNIRNTKIRTRLESWFGEVRQDFDLWNRNVIEAIFKFTGSVVRRFGIYMRCGSVLEAFGSKSEMSLWIQRCEQALLKFSYINDPKHAFDEGIVDEAFNVFSLKNDFEMLIAESKPLLSVTEESFWVEKRAVRNYVDKLRLGQVKIIKIVKSFGARQAPFGVLLFGRTAQLKSTLVRWVFNQYAEAVKEFVLLERDSKQFLYSKHPHDDRWDAFTSEKWAILLDDLATIRPEASNGVPPDSNQILCVQNNVPYIPEQAHLDDKGQTPLKNHLTIGTTNLDHLNVAQYFMNSHAQLRRWDVKLEIILKKEYRDAYDLVAKSKLPRKLHEFDIWDFTLFDFKPNRSGGVERIDLKTFTNIRDLGLWFQNVARTHKIQQMEAVRVSDEMDTSRICEHCTTMFTTDICPYCFPGLGSDFNPPPPNEGEYHVQDAPPAKKKKKRRVCECGSPGAYCSCGLRYRPFEEEEELECSAIPLESPTFCERAKDWWFTCGIAVLYVSHFFSSAAHDFVDYFGPSYLKILYWTQNKALNLSYKLRLAYDCARVEKKSHLVLEIFSFVPIFFLNIVAGSIDWWAWVIATCGTKACKNKRLTLRALVWLNRFRNWTLKWCTKCAILKVSARLQIMRTRYANLAQSIGYFMPGLSLVAASVAIWRRFSSTKKNESKFGFQQGLEGDVPMPSNERENPWQNTGPSLHHTSFSHSVLTSGNMSEQSVMEKLEKHIFNGEMIDTKRKVSKPLVLFCVERNVVVTNYHHFAFAGPGYDILRLTNRNSSMGITPIFDVQLNTLKKYRVPGEDLIFFNVPSMPGLPSVKDMFPKERISHVYNQVFYLNRNDSCTLNKIAISNMSYIDTVDELKKQMKQVEVGPVVVGGFAERETRDGDCGMPMIFKAGSDGWVIAGIHTAYGRMGNHHRIFAWPLYQSHIEAALRALPPSVLGAPPFLKKGDGQVSVQNSLHRKSPLLFIAEGSAYMFGSLDVHRRTMKSKVRKTFIHNEILELPFPKPFTSQHGPPIMRGWKPKRKALLDILEDKPNFPNDILRTAIEGYFTDVMDALDPSELDFLQIYQNSVVVNGCAQVAYVDGIKRKTSAGFPYYHSKTTLLHEVPPLPFAPHPVDFEPEVWDRVRDMECKALNRERTGAVFTAQLKDEPVSERKIAQSATRVFSGSPVDFLLLTRKYTLSFIRLLQRNRFAFEAGPGTIVQSSEWAGLYAYLTHHGEDRIVAGDYASFDKSMAPEFILGAFEIIKRVCACGRNYPREGLDVLDSIAQDIAFPYTDFFGDLVMFIGSNPSGHPLTAIINSIVNSLYMRCVYILLNPERELSTFKKNVRLFTYGDDNIFGVSRDCPWYNHTTISNCFKQYGITYTMAEKDAKSVPYIHIKEATFLKRSFRYDPDIQNWVAPLDYKSLCKTLLWHVKSAACSEGYLALVSVANAQRELFFYGKEIFEKYRSIFLCLSDKLAPFIPLGIKSTTLDGYLPTWDEEMTRFKESNERLQRVRMQSGRSSFYCHLNGEALSGNISVQSGAIRLPFRVSTKDKSVDFMSKFEGFYHSLISYEKLRETLMARPHRLRVLCEVKLALTDKAVTSNEMDVIPTRVEADDVKVQQTSGVTSFVEDTPNNVLKFGPLEDKTFSEDALEGIGLEEFLSRPVRIAEYPWTQGGLTTFNFDPWTLFFNTPQIKKKLDNYAYIQCNLHVKVVMNTSPFYYGCLRLTYSPLPDLWLSDVNGGDKLIVYSQRPGLMLHPSCCEGAEMILPFMWHKDWLDISRASELASMGRLRFDDYFALSHANGLSSTSMDVSIYAWATNIKLSGPTAKLAIQSGKPKPIKTNGKKSTKDEYKLSNIATTVANFSGSLVPIPVIAPFAKATQIGASAVASIASLFGFSKVPVLKEAAPMHNQALGPFAVTETGAPMKKLAIDPKNEISIDPRTVGLPGGDEMDICSIVCRESYIGVARFGSTTVAGTMLMYVPVTPSITFKADGGITQDYMNMTPMSMVSQNFKYWRGDIKIRLRAICTKFHKARLRVHWDPVHTPGNTEDMTPTSFTKIIDIEPEMDSEFIISFNQDAHWLLTQSAEEGVFPRLFDGATLAPSSVSEKWNGTFSVYLLNVLSSPGSSSDIGVQLFMSGTPSLEFAFPEVKATTSWSYFTIQSGNECSMNMGSDKLDDDAYHVYHGEVVRSMRTLLRRTVSMPPIAFSTNTVESNIYYGLFIHPVFPVFNGTYAGGFQQFTNSSGTGKTAGNLIEPSTYGILMPCFVGMRGSVQWHYNVNSFDRKNQNLAIGRCTYPYYKSVSENRYSFVTFSDSTDPSEVASNIAISYSQFQGGYEVINPSVMPTLSLSVPFYSRYRFAATKPDTITGNVLDSEYRKLRGFTYWKRADASFYSLVNTIVDRFCEMGPDFTGFFFHGVPTMLFYKVPRNPEPY